jgi:uncharacterized RDD family membrane protein YckC
MGRVGRDAMMTQLPNPQDNPELFEGILLRRMLAYIVDCVIICVFTVAVALVTVVVGVLTLGVALIALPFCFPIAVLLYYAATLGSERRSTIGMQFFDIVLTPTSGPPLDGWKVLIHPIVFWVTIWVFWPLLFIGLFTQRRQLLHDMITGTLMLRRSPMERHWSAFNGFTA